MASSTVNLSFQDEVPEHVSHSDTEDEFTTDEEDGHDENEGDQTETSDEFTEREEESGKGQSMEAQKQMNGNPAWADAMSQVLRAYKAKGEKSVVLARAKKLSSGKKLRPKPDTGFEIDGKSEENAEKKPGSDSQLIRKVTSSKKRKRTAFDQTGRVKPFALERPRERILGKIATKGVVQLFNVVRSHQKEVNQRLNEAGLERKKEKILQSVSKKDFLDMLMGPTASNKDASLEIVEPKTEPEESAPTWNVLRDDFMMGATLKDWDKQEPPEQISDVTEKVKKRKAR